MSRLLRLFVAAYPPRPIVERWLEAAREMLPGDVTVGNPEQVHLTLIFLGEHDERELPDIRESIGRSIKGFAPLKLQPRHMIMLPDRGAPRLLAATTDLPAPLAEIQRRLSQRLALDRLRKSVFLPHLTLARFPGRSVERSTRPLPDAPFEITEIRLMRSRLLAGGAIHELDKAFALQPS
ncbi:MAG: RNA 2',3'-cyclic phosphodiesterase [Phycisphaeraceae bacterium]|nr:RNA 2',3'-cyclic phosphodiesterase [Phycisphaeraceae bacterium]